MIMMLIVVVVITKTVGIISLHFLALQGGAGRAESEGLGLGSWEGVQAMHKLTNAQHWQHTRSREVKYMRCTLHRAPNMTLAGWGQMMGSSSQHIC